jgi:hypothetical protein
VYTVIAGLLNILVICDAYAGPLLLNPRKNEPHPDGDEATAAEPAKK